MMPVPFDVRQILCPTDFSVFSERALRHALALAEAFRARLQVLHVVPPPALYGGEPFSPSVPRPTSEELREEAEEEMRRFVGRTSSARVTVSTEVREGVAWREILAAAAVVPADLVVLGTHGRRGLEALLLGSVTEKLLERPPCPVMTVCHEEGRTWSAPGLQRRILAALDFGPSGGPAAACALALSARLRAELTLLHVLEALPEQGVWSRAAPPEDEPVRAELRRWAQARLREVVPEESRAGVAVRERLEAGSAPEQILRVAAEEQADLVVLGTSTHGRLGRLLLGSTSKSVVRGATCPVLSVPRAPWSGERDEAALVAASRGEVP